MGCGCSDLCSCVIIGDGQTTNVQGAGTAGDPFVFSAVGAFAIPTGAGLPWFGGTTPTGFELLEGQELDEVVFSNLFAEVGTKWNDGSEAPGFFRLADSRRRYILGSHAGVPGFELGDDDGIAVASRVGAAHLHIVDAHGHTIDLPNTGSSVPSGFNLDFIAGISVAERNAIAAGASPPISPASGLQIIDVPSNNHTHTHDHAAIGSSNATPGTNTKDIDRLVATWMIKT